MLNERSFTRTSTYYIIPFIAQENAIYGRKESELLVVVSWGDGNVLSFDRHIGYKDVHNLSKTH